MGRAHDNRRGLSRMKIEAKLDISGALKKIKGIHDTIDGKQGNLYQDVSKVSADSINANFNASGRPAWTPRKGTYSHPILDKTGKMRDTSEYSARHDAWKHAGTSHQLDIRATDYGKYHQSGTRKMVMRKFINLLQSEIQQIKQNIVRAIHG